MADNLVKPRPGGPPDFFAKHVGVSYFKPISQYGKIGGIRAVTIFWTQLLQADA